MTKIVTTSGDPIKDQRNAEMYRLYTEEDWTTQDLADEFGLSLGRIRNIFRARGWQMRKPGGLEARYRQ